MSRVLSFSYFCDNAKAAKHPPLTVTADTVLVYSPKQKQVVELEVCDPCLSTLHLPDITALADTLGRKIEEPDADPLLVCPYGCNNSRPFKNTAGRTRHLTIKHPDHEEPEPDS